MLWRNLTPATSRVIRNARSIHVVSKPEIGSQTSPSYKYKFLKEPATTAVRQLPVSCYFSNEELMSRLSDVHSGISNSLREVVELMTSGGQARSGVDLGPNRLIKAGIIPQISNLGWEVHYDSSLTFLDIPYNPLPINSPEATEFAGDKPVKSKKGFVQRTEDPDIGRMKKPRLVSAVCERVGEKVGDIAKKGWLPLTLGGDHSLVSCFFPTWKVS